MRFRAPAGSNIGSIALKDAEQGEIVHRPDDDGIFHLPDEHSNKVIGLGWDSIDEPKIEGLTPAEQAEAATIVLVAFRRKLASETVDEQRQILADLRSGSAFDEDDEQPPKMPNDLQPLRTSAG